MNLVRRLPLFATLVVLIAVGVMVRLGFWQLDRMHQKEALLARYASVANLPVIPDLWSERFRGYAPIAYRKVQLGCPEVLRIDQMAGRSASGETGWAQIARCTINGRLSENGQQRVFCFDDCGDMEMDVALGWTLSPAPVQWTGGLVNGTLVPTGKDNYRIIADPPLAGLQPNARPDPSAIPNNHLSYALQWFAFAAAALVIYGLALRKRLAAGGEGG